jgi:antitoxin component of MazEF toxin-antitoxin module
MTTRIVRVGNILTVEIPEELVAQASLPVDEPVEWIANGAGSLALVTKTAAATKPRRPITLDEILQSIPEGAAMEKIDWGPDRGAEVL